MTALASFAFAPHANAQQRQIENPSFEDISTVPSGAFNNGFEITSDANVPGWNSTNGDIELWIDGFQSRDAQEGSYLAELNPSAPVGLYQEVCLLQGEALSWEWYHSARGGGADQTTLYEITDLSGNQVQLLATNTVQALGSNTNNLWDQVTGSTTYSGTSGVQRLQFRSTNAGSSGNFLDNIQISLVPLVTLSDDTEEFENVAGEFPSVVITGILQEDATVTLALGAGTATQGDDFGLTSTTIVIPAGNYNGVSAASLFEIPLVVNEDFEFTEADETVVVSIASVTTPTATRTPALTSAPNVCSNAAMPSATHTIFNTPPAPELVVEKTSDAVGSVAAGDTVTYTYVVENTGNTIIEDVTVADTHDGIGPLSDIALTTFDTANGSTDTGTDALVDSLAPGDTATFEATYIVLSRDILAGSTVTNIATPSGTPTDGTLTVVADDAVISIADTALTALIPGSCGEFLGQGFLSDPGSPNPEVLARFEAASLSGNQWEVYETYSELARNSATGEILFYYDNADGTYAGTFSAASPVIFDGGTDQITVTDDGQPGHTSEVHRFAARFLGEPGTTETITVISGGAQEFMAYWQTDIAGNVLTTAGNPNSSSTAGNENGWIFTAATTVSGGDGLTFDVLLTYPANGEVILQMAIMDPTLNQNSVEIEYDCPEIELDVAKSASVGTLLADGTVDVIYTVDVENTGELSLQSLTLVDDLTAADQLGSAFNGVVAAPVVTLTNTSGTSVTPTTNGAAYDGTNGLVLGTDGTLQPGDIYTVTFTINVDPNAAGAPATLDNMATATAVRTGGTAGVDTVTDDSDTDTAPDGTPDSVANVPGGPGDPTVITLPTEEGTIGLVKTAVYVDVDGSGSATVGDRIDYTYVVTNTSTVVNVYNVSVTEPNDATNDFTGTGTPPVPVHDGTSGSDLDAGDGTPTDIAVGETVTFEAEYIITQADIDTGEVTNSAVATGTDPAGDTPTDVSDESDSTTGNDDPTVVPLTRAELTVVKSITGFADVNGNDLLDAGDTVTFTFTAENTGDTSLANVAIDDTGLSPITVTPIASFDGTLSMTEGAVTVATATYTLTATDVAAGGIENTATGSADPVATDGAGEPIPGTPAEDASGNPLNPVTDVSDAGTTPDIDSATGLPTEVATPADTETPDLSGATDGIDGNDPTALTIPAPGVQIIKSVTGVTDTNSNGITDEGDIIAYSFSVLNTGNTDLIDVAVTDDLVGISISGSPIASLAEGSPANTSITATYALTAADITAGGVENTADATGTAVDDSGTPYANPFDSGASLTTTAGSDAGTDPNGDTLGNPLGEETPALDGSTDGETDNDPTVFLITPEPGISIVKSVANVTDNDGDGLIEVGDTITYSFVVTNTGNTRLENVTVDDAIATVSGNLAILEIDGQDTTTFTASYQIDADDLGAGGVENTAIVSGDAVDADGNPINDPILGTQLTATDDSDSGTEPLLDSTGAVVDVTDPENNETTDLAGDNDGLTDNDPTVLFIAVPELTVVKSLASIADDNLPVPDNLTGGEGDTITYSFTVTNTGNVDLVDIALTDPTATILPAGTTIDLAAGAGDSLTFTATYTIDSNDVVNGYVLNTATATGAAVDDTGTPIYGPDGTPVTVTDTSDTGTNESGGTIDDPANTETTGTSVTPDSDPGNDPTVTSIPENPNPQITVLKSVASVADTVADGVLGEGDTVTYSFVVTNTGNLRLADIEIDDPTAAVVGGPITLDPDEEDTTSFTATAVITAAQAAAGAIENTATVSGNAVTSDDQPISDGTGVQLTADDTSDTGTEPDIPQTGVIATIADPAGTETPRADGSTDSIPTNDYTVLNLPAPAMQVVKSVSSVTDVNGNGFTDAGDLVNYVFSVTNTGNTDLTGVAVVDNLAGLTLTGSPIASLPEGGPANTSVTGVYELLDADIDAGGVENTAVATGTAVDDDGNPLGDPFNPGDPLEVTDTSDAGTDADGTTITDPNTTETPDIDGDTNGDPTDDPTVFAIAPSADISIIKSVADVNDLDGDGLPSAGDEIIYSFLVTNTGNVDLSGIVVTDPLGPITGGPINLAIGDDDATTFSLTYVISATDVTAGGVENTATATGTAVDSNGNDILNDVTGAPLTVSDVSDAGTEPEISSTGLPDDVTDPETTETVDLDGATDADPTNDPTVLIIANPQMTVEKSVATVADTNNDGLFGGEGDIITYNFRVLNTGNVDLVNVVVTDLTADMAGGPIALLTPGQGDATTFTATYEVTAIDVAPNGYVENTAEGTAEAVNEDGVPLLDLSGDPILVEDTSDTGTDPAGDDVTDHETTETPDGTGGTNGDPTDDPTVVTVPANPNPQIEVIKSVASVSDNGDGAIGAGDVITYSFTVTNTGNVPLADVIITDDIATMSGAAISLDLEESDSTTFTATYTIEAADVDAGGVENTAIATGNAVNTLGQPILVDGVQPTAEDTSDAGTEPEPTQTGLITDIDDPAGTESPALDGTTDTDPTNDPTVLFIPNPSFSVTKSVASAADTNGDGTAGGIGDTITYSFVVENTGNTALTNLTLSDGTAVESGGPIDLAIGGINTTAFTATYVVTANDVNVVGYVENSATATATAVGTDGTPLGDPANPGAPIEVEDTSDAGTDATGTDVPDAETTETPDGTNGTNGDPTDDPTILFVPTTPVPEITLIKSVANVVDTDGDLVLGGEDDVVTYSFTVTNTGDADLVDVTVDDAMLGGTVGTIASLPVGTSQTFTVNYTITPADQLAGAIENTATATGDAVNVFGDPLLDPDTNAPLIATDVSDTGTDPVTDPIGTPEVVETADIDGATDSDPTNDPTVLNVPLAVPDTGLSGTVFLDVDEDGVETAGDTPLPNYVVNLVDQDGNVQATTITDGDGNYEFEGFGIGTLDVVFLDPVTGEEVGTIEDLVFDRNTVLTDQDFPVLPAPAPGQLSLEKTTPLTNVILGTAVPYTITVSNVSATPITADIIDTLPPGFIYVDGSALVDGVVTEPDAAGSSLTWGGITVPLGGSVTIELVALVGPSAPSGDLTNTVSAFDADTGTSLAEAATATVRRQPEAVFDCSDIIGKVFNDRNFNGYQDEVDQSAQVSSQEYVGGKFGGEATPLPAVTEDGIAGVRLVTATGTIITTDDFGRFSVPCAELPGATGANFTLKVDPMSLPTGFRITTENPRTMRVTAGIATEMNFGAALGRVLDVDLTAAAFAGTDPVDRLDAGITQLLQQVVDTPAIVRISYFTNGESADVAQARIDALEDLIEARWRPIGRYRLIVETTILRVQ